MKAFTANFDNTSVTRPEFSFDDIDDLVEIVDEIDEQEDGEFDSSEIAIEMNVVGEGELFGFISDFDELNYDLMVELGDCGFDEYFEEGGDKYYQYKYLVDNNGLSAEDAMEKCDDVQVFEGSRAQYAQEFMDDVYDIPTNLINYIDYDAYANDLERDGDISEIADDVWIVNANSI